MNNFVGSELYSEPTTYIYTYYQFMQLNKLTITQASNGLRKKEFSSVELTRACLDRIKNTDDEIKSCITLT